MIRIGDTFYLDLVIDGVSIPVDSMGFDPLQIHSSVMFSQPMGKIVLADLYNYFESKPLSDGSKVDIWVGRNDIKQDAFLYRFRIFKHRVVKALNINYYEIYLTFNCPRYFNENWLGAMTGTSYEVLNQVATTSGVTYSGDFTSDSQTWLGSGKKRCSFAREVAQHGYIDETSCMGLGMTLLGEMRYKNLARIDLGTTKYTFMHGDGDNTKIYRILARKEVNKAGLLNNLLGYRMTTVEQGASESTNHTSVKLELGSPTMLINKILNDRLEGSRVVMTPVVTGNAHPNYYQAEHQNKRIKATYALGLHVVTDGMSSLDLFDPVKYIVYDNTASTLRVNEVISGAYIITAKTIFATKSGKYYEKFELARQGYNFSTTVANQMTALNSGVTQ